MLRCTGDIRVAVIFGPGLKARPVWFELNRRQHRIARTTYHWKDRIGEAPRLHWSVVTEEDALYELVFNTIDQTWLLSPQPFE